MILYHPAKDVYHCVYRLIAIMGNLDEPVSFDKLRILDFYFLFPSFMKDIKPWPSDIKDYKRVVKSVSDSYERVVNKRRLFFEMLPVQKKAISIIKSKDILVAESLEEGQLLLQKDILSGVILEIKESDKFVSSEVFEVIVKGLLSTEWEGSSGLKSRSGLMEYKYDQ